MRRFRVTVNGQTFEVEVEEIGAEPAAHAPAKAGSPGGRVPAPRPAATPDPVPAPAAAAAPAPPATTDGEVVTAPLPGVVLEVKVSEGDAVAEGAVLLVLEAMKMENEITAPRSGTIREVAVQKGASVDHGQTLVVIG